MTDDWDALIQSAVALCRAVLEDEYVRNDGVCVHVDEIRGQG